MRWTSTRAIAAAPSRVFRAVADPEEFHKAIPGGARIEYLTPTRNAVGTKFRSTRISKGKPSTFEMEVTEFVAEEHVRIVNVTHGTLWDSTYSVKSNGASTVLTLTMDARTDRLIGRFMNRLVGPIVQRALDRDLDAVKAYCER